ncbi:methyl-accepting chemotaxis protein [Clostridium sp. MB40-C1]|uniref:methyl-accepting chemotaxis protein n=1 Tax=Clostridium sp. MB40-C1 TaxID=3070996 RepID=UPI0027E1B73F|nr:methyl-accepting chemotaxis protein [Clostridium sp. MB40-C1]WMJ79916.1 methyl-accepting chemotaxis protein [Clostridium sp. MB40-C1]
MKIKKKLPLMIAALVMFSLVITSVLSYRNSSKEMFKINQESLLSACNEEKETIYSLLTGEKKEAELLAISKDIVDISLLRKQDVGSDFFTKYKNEIDRVSNSLKKRYNTLIDHEHLFVLDRNGLSICDSNFKNINKLNIKDRPYFQRALSGETNISGTIVSKVDGRIVSVVATPIKDNNGQIIGVMANSVYSDYYSRQLKKLKIGNTGFPYLVDSEGTILAHPDKNAITKKAGSSLINSVVESIKKGEDVKADVKAVEIQGSERLQAYIEIPEVNWVLSVVRDISDINESSRNMLRMNLIMTIIAIVIAGVIGVAISRNITTPIGKLAEYMEEASNGDLSVESDINSKDELGELSSSFNVMVAKIKELVVKINSSMNIVSSTASTLVETSENTTLSIEEVAKTVQQIAQGSSEQSQDVENVSERMNTLGKEIENLNNYSQDMKANSDDILKENNNSKDIMKALFKKTEDNDREVEKVSQIMEELNKSSANIGDIVEAINSIAEQTNLLALNAAIEAARAGEAGKGFAVVAEEVRLLAEQSAESTKKIEEIITDIKNRTGDAVNIVGNVKKAVKDQTDSVNETGKTFDIISGNIENIADKIDNINNSLININKNKELVIGDLEKVSVVSEETAASSEEVSASTEEQAASMQELASYVTKLNGMVNELSEAINAFTIE